MVEALTRELADAWAADGVSVVAVALGRFATESIRKYPAGLWRRAAESVPLQRLGLVEEFGWLIALLASPLGPALSGSMITLGRRPRQLVWTLATGVAIPGWQRPCRGTRPATRLRRRGPPACERRTVSKRRTGIEPASSPWKGEALPLSYHRASVEPGIFRPSYEAIAPTPGA